MNDIIQSAVAQGEAEKARIIEEANRAAADIKRQAEMAIQHELAEAKLRLREEVANQAVVMAEELIRKNLQETDQVKLIDVYPQAETLANIRSQEEGTGGAPYNVLIDLAKSGTPFPLYAAGLVGQDTLGEHILADCRRQ